MKLLVNMHQLGNMGDLGCSGQSPMTTFVDESFHVITYSNGGSPTNTNGVSMSLEAVLNTKNIKKIKMFVRKCGYTADDTMRKNFWWKICCAMFKDTASASIYDETVKDIFGEEPSDTQVTLPTFVDLTTMQHYHISEHGIHAAKRVMCVLDLTCPDITYAPLVYPIACLMLHYMSESDSYNCIYGMIRSNARYLSQTKKAYQMSKYILLELAKKYAKPFCTFVRRKGLKPEVVLEHWILWIFRCFPFSHLVRVFDCYLVEGPKVFYRVGLVILIHFHKHIVQSSPGKQDDDLSRAISQYCEDLPIPPERLLKLAFGIRRLSCKDIRKHEVRAEMYINSLQNVSMPPSLPKSESCASLNLKVSRSFSGPPPSSNTIEGDLQANQQRHHSQKLDAMSVITERCKSTVLCSTHFQAIWSWLPMRVTLNHPVLLYTSAEHGTSLSTFFGKVDYYEPTLLLIKTSKGDVFGAYCSNDWSERAHHVKDYFGTGECFVFTLCPRQKCYSWVGLKLQEKTPNTASLFMSGSTNELYIGGGGGESIALDSNLFKGRSQRSLTFDNEPLAADGDFECVTVEVFGFE